MSRQNRWFQPKDGISREVIQADIQRYLGRDATVRPGVENGVDGYWITAYRTLTTEMVKDLQLDSRRWAQELSQGRERYTDSATHQSRQYYGPSDATPAQEAPTAAAYASQSGYATQQYATQPASAYPDDRNRQRAPAAQASYPSPQQAQNYTYSTQSQAYAQQPAYAAQPGYAQTASSQYYQQPGYPQPGYAPAAASTEPRTTPSGYYQAAGQAADPYAASRYPAQQQAPAGYQYAQAPAAASTRETVYSPTPASSSSQAYYSSSYASDPRQSRR